MDRSDQFLNKMRMVEKFHSLSESAFVDTLKHVFELQPSAVVIGAMALTMYTNRPRMTADIDILSSHPVTAFSQYFDPVRGMPNTMNDRETHIDVDVLDASHPLLNRKVVTAAVKTAVTQDFGGLKMRVITPEMLVAMKLARAIHPSTKGRQDQVDIENLMKDNPELDLDKIRPLLTGDERELLDDIVMYSQQ
jgi:hypothetical protein